MKILVNCCDNCKGLGENLILTLCDNKELCPRCAANWKYEQRCIMHDANRQLAPKLNGCDKCKQSGILHRSIYGTGSGGYYDEPDPTIYCKCPKGRALDPDTNILLTEDNCI